MFAVARGMLSDCARVAVVGDNLEADIAGARRAGLASILVLSGATVAADLEHSQIRPDHVLPTLAALDSAPPRGRELKPS